MRLIPAIDIIDGKCVRLTKGDYSQKKIYNEHPLEIAMQFQDAGIRNLHLVDLDGAKAGKIINWKVLEKIANETSLHIDFGGGLKSDNDLRIAFECGAKQITGGSIAVKNKETFLSWISQFGSEKIILGADAKNERIAVSGWLEETDEFIYDFIRDYSEKGIEYCICTDISKDGMLEGPSFALYEKILNETPNLKLIASGGVASMDDLYRLREKGLYACIIGKAIYEGKIKLNDLSLFHA
ncbi:MAG: 1-(5-phosphoribosyl)-5-[(5-phosphoribosylamino)methylideneamino]imidazole-4-carboxamide isomerase [Flavobacteriales bacterium]|nr:1-(5-phosphoribosyl)-5-[(5-phosphoribosylamino)methylideneamino]imidazole-4-carboxamide isomerase [Flavobacteriales bacterium]